VGFQNSVACADHQVSRCVWVPNCSYTAVTCGITGQWSSRMIVDRDGRTAISDLPTAHSLAGTAGSQRTIEECRGPVGAELAIHGGDSTRRELLDRTLIINRRHLTAVLTEYVAHFNHHRPHRALHQAAPLRSLPPPTSPSRLHLRRRDLLGGLIHDYAQSHDVDNSSAPTRFSAVFEGPPRWPLSERKRRPRCSREPPFACGWG
jgi:hypothetical protein